MCFDNVLNTHVFLKYKLFQYIALNLESISEIFGTVQGSPIWQLVYLLMPTIIVFFIRILLYISTVSLNATSQPLLQNSWYSIA